MEESGFNACIICGKKPSPVKETLFWRAECCGRVVTAGGGFENLIEAWNAENKGSKNAGQG
jgi:hypothetical protein